MINVSLENNPLMQLNLLLWMSLNGKESWINPYFNYKGYEILVIEPELPLPPRHVNILNRNDIKFIDNPKPEVILINEKFKKYLIVECKNQCFNLDDHDSRSTQQAVSFLVYNAELISESFGIKADDYSGLLNYNFMKNDYLNEFTETIIGMQKNLRNLLNEDINLPSTSYFVEKDKVLYLNFIDLDDLNSEINLENEIKVMNLSEDNVIAPLYLIPIDSSGNTDKYGELVFYKRLKSNFGSFLGNLNNIMENDEIILDIESDILENIISIWDIWDNAETKKYIRNKTRLYLNGIITKLDKSIDDFSYQSINDGYTIEIKDRSTIDKLRNEFLKVAIKRENDAIKKNQLSLNFNDNNTLDY
jgi:hypothetical protein